MSIYVGGLRARMIQEAIYRELRGALESLGWFDSNRAHSPIIFLAEAVEDQAAVAVNTAALTSTFVDETEEELGSHFSEHRWTFYVDFYAENEAIGTHFTSDLKDIVSGRMPSIGRSEPRISVYDYTQATPSWIFDVGVENVFMDRPSIFTYQWQRFYRALHFEIVDSYGQDTDYA